MKEYFDIVVIGGGHAGIEAAWVSSEMGLSVALITMDEHAIGRMSCNPAIGGSAKGHLVREIDALGGLMGKIADNTGIMFKMLNKSKGPAVWSPRCQSDRELYSKEALRFLKTAKNLHILEDIITEVKVKDGRITGVKSVSEREIETKAVIVCAGTFLNGKMFTGHKVTIGGRYEEPHATGLTEILNKLGFTCGRLKTGTPPRLKKESIDFSVLEEQKGDDFPQPFSFQTIHIPLPQISCFITYTNERTHKTLEEGFQDSPLFTGRIQGVGPRYCPSIEDKINRFRDKERHQLFLEPEGLDSNVIYLNGFSSSLPADIQMNALRTLPGLENVEMIRPGYAVEYDFFPPHQVELTLETKLIEGLYFAGQINGTSGYEEAAAQGIMAGINAALKIQGKPPLVLKRTEAYIGVLIDDLVNKGTEEPYRMFTSRAEYRLLLRQDNADRRLMPVGYNLGLIPSKVFKRLEEKEDRIKKLINYCNSTSISPKEINHIIEQRGGTLLEQSEPISKIVKRSELSLAELLDIKKYSIEADPGMVNDVINQVEIEMKYEGYIKRQNEEAEKFLHNESLIIPKNFNYDKVKSLSSEGREKLNRIRPANFGQACRISGLRHSDLAILLVYLK